MSERTVQVETLVDYAVVLEIPEYHYGHIFHGNGKKTRINFDALLEGVQNDGIRNLFTYSILRVVDKKDRIDLGLETPVDEIKEDTNIEEVEVEEEIFSMSVSEILTLLKSNDTKKIEDALKKANPVLVEEFVRTAIKFKVYTGETIDVLQKYSTDGTDINKLIALARAAEKPEVE